MPGVSPRFISLTLPGFGSGSVGRVPGGLSQLMIVTALVAGLFTSGVVAQESLESDRVGTEERIDATRVAPEPAYLEPVELESTAANVDSQAVDPDAILTERSITSRVLGGSAAEVGEWPSVVALVRFGNRPLKNRFFCGGTVVADRWVLTAAHCLFTASNRIESAAGIRVVAGITDLENDEFAPEMIVTNIYVHPDYDNLIELPPYDIALLELATDINAPKANLFAGDTVLYDGSIGFVAGWGATEFENDVGINLPSLLQDAAVPLVPLAECNAPESYGGIVTMQQMCAGFREGGVDTCSGDSGGPLFIIENGQNVQVGITSFGDGCGVPGKYGIYTDVSQLISWLGLYIPVPTQPQALLDLREQRELGITPSESEERSFLGAFQPMSLSLLFGIVMMRRAGRRSIRRAACHGTRQLAGRLSTATKMRLLPGASVIVLLVSTTGCAASGTTAGEPTDFTNEDTSVPSLVFTEQSGRPGVNDLVLGELRDTSVAAIEAWTYTQTDCQLENTGIRGNGRAFLKETCVFEPVTGHTVAQLVIQQITAQFLDESLVGLQIVATGPSMALLIEQINAQYDQSQSAARPFEWLSTQSDIVRLTTSTLMDQDDGSQVTIEIVDAAIDGRIASMFELK